jgi:hypothetical protein
MSIENIIIAIIIMLLVVAFILSKRDRSYDPDPEQYDYFGEEFRPFIMDRRKACRHEGERTNVVVSSVVTCEEVHEFCDDCGADLGKISTDC